MIVHLICVHGLHLSNHSFNIIRISSSLSRILYEIVMYNAFFDVNINVMNGNQLAGRYYNSECDIQLLSPFYHIMIRQV